MQPTRELIDDLYREKVLRARRMKPEDKLLAGARLFAFASSITKAGIRNQFPDADEAEVNRLFRERLKLGRWLEANP